MHVYISPLHNIKIAKHCILDNFAFHTFKNYFFLYLYSTCKGCGWHTPLQYVRSVGVNFSEVNIYECLNSQM